MRIAVINETSAADKNKEIIRILNKSGHEIFNCGMTEKGAQPELQYIHTGFMAALLLATDRADFIIGGCGTGQGFLNSVMQYPGVFCGHIINDLDAWLFAQINGGNCISLALNQGWGWAGDVNLEFIFEKLFSVEPGSGYPAERKVPQGVSREKLVEISSGTHFAFAEIINNLSEEVVEPVFKFPGFMEILNLSTLKDQKLKNAILQVSTPA